MAQVTKVHSALPKDSFVDTFFIQTMENAIVREANQ